MYLKRNKISRGILGLGEKQSKNTDSPQLNDKAVRAV
jgi:hypothetical protein